MNLVLITLMKNKADLTLALLESIKEKSEFWKNPGNVFKVVIGDTGSDPQEYYRITEYAETAPFEISQYEIGEYNFARNNNQLALPYKGTDTVLLFCNNDIELVNDAITKVAETCVSSPKCGTVGARLVFPDGAVQHCGIYHKRALGKLKTVGHLYYKQKKPESFFEGIHLSCGNTAAFMAVKSSVFWEMCGFDENYKKCFEDVDFNCRVMKKGLLNRTRFDAVAIHKESSTRTTEQDQNDIKMCTIQLTRKPVATLVCIAKGEDEHMKEWIEYHLKLGFKKIFVYMNDWRCELAGMYDRVEFICLDGYARQLDAYNYFIRRHRRDFDFALFIDSDEYLCLKQDENVSDFCKRYLDKGAVAINWRMFGTDKDVDLPYGYSVVQSFKTCQPAADKHVKTMLNLINGRMAEFVNPHYVDMSIGDFVVSADGKTYVHGPFNEGGGTDIAQINHYYKRTLREFQEKIDKGKADTKPSHPMYRHTMDLYSKYYGYTAEDDTAARFQSK